MEWISYSKPGAARRTPASPPHVVAPFPSADAAGGLLLKSMVLEQPYTTKIRLPEDVSVPTPSTMAVRQRLEFRSSSETRQNRSCDTLSNYMDVVQGARPG